MFLPRTSLQTFPWLDLYNPTTPLVRSSHFYCDKQNLVIYPFEGLVSLAGSRYKTVCRSSVI
jgi:hypothetical protein